MINRQHRFHGRGSLRFVYQKGQTVRGQYSSLKYARSRRASYRVAVVVSRKVHKSAVMRNRIRRRLYEAIRQVPIAEAYDLVLTVYSDQLATLPSDQIRELLITQLARAGILEGVKPETRHDIVEAKEK